MLISDWINIFLCILSFILAAISVVTVVITLRQNNKMIENSSRPYVVAVAQITNFQSPSLYLVIKNYGNSGATVKDVKFSIDLTKYSYSKQLTPFSNISNTFIAPNQAIPCSINNTEMAKDGFKSFDVKIEYTDGIHNYSETYPINFAGLAKNIQTRASTKDKELKIISYTLQDLVEKQF